MNKYKLFCLAIIFTPFVVFAQEDGIRFEHNLSWPAILAKASAEKKYIFMDCYTTWCAPCRYMSQKVFVQKSVGEFFNAHFINVAVQMDQRINDSEDVRQWYACAKDMESRYSITAYPTFLFFSPDGVAVDRLVGSFPEEDFIKRANDALIPQRQYYTLINFYKEHLDDSIFLRNALNVVIEKYDRVNAAKIAKCYIDCVKEPFTKENLELLFQVNPGCSDEVFRFILENAGRIDTIMKQEGDGKIAEITLSRIVAHERVPPLFNNRDTILKFSEIIHQLENAYPTLKEQLEADARQYFEDGISGSISAIIFKDGAPIADWKKITRTLQEEFPGYDCGLLLGRIKPVYYMKKKMWTECTKTALALVDRYGDKLGPRELNNIAWDYLFMHCSDQKCLQDALKWSKRSRDLAPAECSYIDTYANILYKMGNINEAVDWEKKAIEKGELYKDEPDLKDFQINLEKMQKGEKTWM